MKNRFGRRFSLLLISQLVNVSVIYAAPLVFDQIDLDQSRLLPLDGAEKTVVLAVIDDGFSVTHPSLRGMVWRNTSEIAFNGIDDDSNGYVDDRTGWDIADMDGELAPPSGRLNEFNHGAYTAALIADIVRAKLGEQIDYPIKLMLVKAVSDQSDNLDLRLGYRGIDYAIQNGASIVSNAWSGGTLEKEHSQILNFALAQDVFVVNSVGNFPSEQASVPAVHPGVFGVAGVDASGRIIDESNYGSEVDLVSIARDISSISLVSQSGQQSQSGTSVAVPAVAATVALMRLVNPRISRNEIRDCLLNTAKQVDTQNQNIAGKLGAGLLQVDAAIDCAKTPVQSLLLEKHVNTKGSIGLSYSPEEKEIVKKWRIEPAAAGQGLVLFNSVSGDASTAFARIFELEGQNKILHWEGAARALPDKLVLDRSVAEIELTIPANSPNFSLKSHYALTPIDLEKQFCSGKEIISENTVIDDGSGSEPYAALTNCKWLVQSKPGQSVRIHFKSFDIDPQSDKIYLFRGDNTEQTSLLVSLTGNESPPKYIVEGGDVLIWLLSDESREAQGFTAEIDWVDAPEG